MSRKNHKMIDGKLLRTDKNFSHLKRSQATQIDEWMRTAYNAFRDQKGYAPHKQEIDQIADSVYEQICEADIWIPYYEIQKRLRSKLIRLANNYEKMRQDTK